jgi:hypothetical protein
MSTGDVTAGTAAEVLAGTALTADNGSVDIAGTTLVHRRFGDSETDAPPLVCLPPVRGNLRFIDALGLTPVDLLGPSLDRLPCKLPK